MSGALFASREHFQRLMRDADAGAFQAVVFYDLDRFGRNARHTMHALNTLVDLGITIWDYSTGQQVDLDSFEGEMMTFMKARFAQQYRDQVRKHTPDAMREKAKQGYVTGGKLFGYDNVRVGKGQTERRVNEAQAAVVRDIYERFAAGDGLPVADVNEAVLQAIEEHALTPEAIEQVIRLSERDDVAERQAALARERTNLDTRIARLVAAVETAGDVAPLVAKLRELQARRTTVDKEAAALRPIPRPAPAVLEDRLAEWRRLLRSSTTQGRAVLQRILRGRLTFTPHTNPISGEIDGYEFERPTRYAKLFSGLAVETQRTGRMVRSSRRSIRKTRWMVTGGGCWIGPMRRLKKT